jgi:hypothetical protein
VPLAAVARNVRALKLVCCLRCQQRIPAGWHRLGGGKEEPRASGGLRPRDFGASQPSGALRGVAATARPAPAAPSADVPHAAAPARGSTGPPAPGHAGSVRTAPPSIPSPSATSRTSSEKPERSPLAAMAAPKGHGPRHRRPFILQTASFWGCAVGHDGDHGPRQLGPSREGLGQSRGAGRCPRCGSTCSRREQKKQTSPLLPPKGTDHGPCGFSPANRPFLGTAGGDHDRRSWTPRKPTPRCWAKAMPRRGGTSCVCKKSRRAHCCPKGRGPRTGSLFPRKPAVFRDRREGP